MRLASSNDISSTVLRCVSIVVALSSLATALDVEDSRSPSLLWAQRRQMLYVYVKIPNLEPGSLAVNLTDTRLELTAQSSTDGSFRTEVEFFRKVESRTATWSDHDKGTLSGVQIIVPKFWEWRYWPRLTRQADSALPIAVDWKRWKRDDSEDALTRVPDGEDEEWWDDEVAPVKAAVFADDDFDASAVPLLRAATLEEFPMAFDMTAVLFFSRAMNAQSKVTRSALRAFAAVAKYVRPHNLSVACVDVGADSALARAFHIHRSPAVKLFFPDGEMFDVNMNPLTSAKLLLHYLLKQRAPAFETVTSLAGAEKAFADLDRMLLHLHDSKTPPGLTRAFDLVAKEWRADTIGLVLKAAAMHRNVLAQMKLLNETDAAPEWVRAALAAMGAAERSGDFTGVLMVKREEAVQAYAGPPLKRNLHRWSIDAQINAMEPMSTASLQYIRSFKLPVLYVILNQPHVSAAASAELRAIRSAAARFAGKVFFMWGIASVHASIVDYLGCQFNGHTYAVLEDQVEDYKYCVETDAKNKLTSERVTRLLEDYTANKARPDVLKSEQPPRDDDGPVFKVVGSNLMETVMDASRDVVLHIYTDSDNKWRDDSFILEKVAKDLEHVSTVYVGKLDGLKNQPAPEFPDLGYFPCTWMFPANHKSRPLMFNATLGFSYDRLITWVQKTADLKFDLDDETVERRLKDLGDLGGATDGVSFEALEQLYVEEQNAKAERRRKVKKGTKSVTSTGSHGLDFETPPVAKNKPVSSTSRREILAEAPRSLQKQHVARSNHHSEL